MGPGSVKIGFSIFLVVHFMILLNPSPVHMYVNPLLYFDLKNSSCGMGPKMGKDEHLRYLSGFYRTHISQCKLGGGGG